MKPKTILILLTALFFLYGCGASDISQLGSSTSSGSSAPPPPTTEITATGAGTTILISPSEGNTISGTVTITATKVPDETGIAGFSIQGGDIPEDVSNTNIRLDQSSNDGFSAALDTTQYPNGQYEITMIAGSSDFQRRLGSATAGVVIQN